ncbi:MAG: GxxExxY protein [Ignavibacteriales bacterium]|nr:GxxExxY protein [Ignavibacteriales bacterium]
MVYNELTHKVIGCAMKVHSTLGPGLLESAYEECLAYELSKSGIVLERQKPMPLVYDGVKLDCGYRMDILVESKLVLELKAVDMLNDIHLAQILTYLKLSGCELGLLINFNVVKLKDGLRRVINSN